MTSLRKLFDLFEFYFDPDLTNVRAAFLSAKKSVVEKRRGAGEVSGLGFVENEFVEERV